VLRLSDSTKYSLLTNQPSKLNAAANTATRPTPLLASLIPICYLFTPLPRIPPHLSTHALRSPSPSRNSDSHPGAANPPQNIQLHASTTPQPSPQPPKRHAHSLLHLHLHHERPARHTALRLDRSSARYRPPCGTIRWGLRY